MIDLNEIQKQVYQNKLDKKFNVTDVSMEFALTYGELAEAYDAYWKKKGNVGEELADVMIYLLRTFGNFRRGFGKRAFRKSRN